MNKKIVVIIALTIIALVLLSIYTFTPLRKNTSLKGNPVSLKPIVSTNDAIGSVTSFHNKDMKENYYTVSFPKEWNIKVDKPGEYLFSFTNGNGSIQLMDVPDNGTLELFILSQKEPEFKKTVTGYIRKNYQKLLINGMEAYELVYQKKIDNLFYLTHQIFITGADQAVVLTFNVKESDNTALKPVFEFIPNSFKWENE
jgi:hypothetical protein